MPLKETLRYMAVGIAGVALLISLVALLHSMTGAGGFHDHIHELEVWVSETGYSTALIVLAAAGVFYLTRKD